MVKRCICRQLLSCPGDCLERQADFTSRLDRVWARWTWPSRERAIKFNSWNSGTSWRVRGGVT